MVVKYCDLYHVLKPLLFYWLHVTVLLQRNFNYALFATLFILAIKLHEKGKRIAMKFLFNIILWILLLGLLSGQSLAELPDESSKNLANRFVTNVVKHIKFLGDDSLEGRGTGTYGEFLASEYIVEILQQYRLDPAARGGRFFQRIPMHGSRPLADSELRLHKDRGIVDFELGRDYLLYKSGEQTFIGRPAPLVFAGYGILAPEFDYNDYQNLDVAGKIVVMLSGEPASGDDTYFAGAEPSIYAYPESKQRLAISRGAIGSIIIADKSDDWQQLRREFSVEDVTLLSAVSSHLSLMITSTAAAELFVGSKYRLSEVQQMAGDNNLRSFALNAALSFKGQFIQRDFIARNIIAKLPGRDKKLRDEYLLITAHYDHLGVGEAVEGDSIYNGVFDNALGVATALEIAGILANNPPARSTLFLFLTGEEKGLLGAHYYLDNPVVPLYRTVASINVDGMAIYDTFKDVVGVGAELSTLADFLERAATRNGLSVSPIPKGFLQGETFARSDQIAFAQAGIPAILVTEGLDWDNFSRAEAMGKMIAWQKERYHSPFDDLFQPINFQAVWQHALLLETLCREIADDPNPPAWHKGVPYRYPRLQSRAEKR